MNPQLELRVAVLDVWGNVPVHVSGDTSIAELKRQALESARVVAPASEYLVKFRGAELRDERVTLAQAEVASGSALIVLPRRRSAVR